MPPQALRLLFLTKAFISSRTVFASFVLGFVLPVSVSVGRHIFKIVSFGTDVNVPILYINEFILSILSLLVAASSSSHRSIYSEVVQVLTYRRGVIPCIQAYRKRLEAEFSYLIL